MADFFGSLLGGTQRGIERSRLRGAENRARKERLSESEKARQERALNTAQADERSMFSLAVGLAQNAMQDANARRLAIAKIAHEQGDAETRDRLMNTPVTLADVWPQVNSQVSGLAQAAGIVPATQIPSRVSTGQTTTRQVPTTQNTVPSQPPSAQGAQPSGTVPYEQRLSRLAGSLPQTPKSNFKVTPSEAYKEGLRLDTETKKATLALRKAQTAAAGKSARQAATNNLRTLLQENTDFAQALQMKIRDASKAKADIQTALANAEFRIVMAKTPEQKQGFEKAAADLRDQFGAINNEVLILNRQYESTTESINNAKMALEKQEGLPQTQVKTRTPEAINRKAVQLRNQLSKKIKDPAELRNRLVGKLRQMYTEDELATYFNALGQATK